MVDYSQLTPEVQELLERAEANSTDTRQLNALNGMSEILKLIVDSLTQLSEETLSDTQQTTEALAAVRDAVDATKKAMPELPDYSGPIVKAVAELEKKLSSELSKLELAPTIEGPSVNVEAPAVDLKGVEKVIRQDLAKAFNEAIKNIPKTEIPKTDLSKAESLLSDVLEQLGSIDTGVRMKPQFPNSIQVSNTVTTTPQTLTERYDYDDSTTIYTATAPVGTADASTGWTIIKYDLTDTNDASGKVATDVSWTNRASGSYS